MRCTVLVALGLAAGFAVAAVPPPPAGVSDLPAYARSFDSSRDPVADIQLAREAAAQHQRNVLVMVGGDWCVWCFLLDRHFSIDAEAASAWYGGFEVMRVYYNDDNTNQAFLRSFPDFDMFPHFYVVSADGGVLASVTADVLIRDAKYDTALIRQFVQQWTVHPSLP